MPRLDRPTPPRRATSADRPVIVGDRTVLVVTPAPGVDGDPGCVHTGLVMPVLGRIVDVTFHPAAARTALWDAADRTRTPRPEAEVALRGTLGAAASRVRGWTAPPDTDLLAALGGAAYPLLAAAYGGGSAPLHEVPRWAVPLVAAPTARAGARALLGLHATRPVIGALARRLVEATSAAAALARVALVLIGSPALEPDRSVRVLEAPGPDRVEADLPPNEVVSLGRAVVGRWGALRTERALLDAAAHPDGLRLLGEALRFARDLGVDAPRRLPNRLVDLHDCYRARVVTDALPVRPVLPARPDRPVRPAVAPAPAARTTARRAPDPRERIFRPPTTGGTAAPRVTAATPIVARGPLAALDGSTVGPLRLVLPRTCGDLTRWGRLLANCLGDYGPAAVTGRSAIVGVERDGALRYALELTAEGVVRQFVGAANRPPDPTDRAAVLGRLVEAGAVAPHDRRNGPWMADAPVAARSG